MRWVFFDGILNQRVFQWPKIEGSLICVTDILSEKPFMALLCADLCDLHLVGAGAGTKCFPLSHLKDSALARFRERYSDDTISKEAVFHYIVSV